MTSQEEALISLARRLDQHHIPYMIIGGLADLVDLLLERGTPTNLAEDEPWATPLAWAQRRGYDEIAAKLRQAGARK